MIEKVIPFSHSLLKKVVNLGDIVIDGTVGNGKDTLFLAQLVGETGLVYGFDIQQEAIERASQLLRENRSEKQVKLHCTGHENLKKVIPEADYGKIKGAIYNLGYLPKGDHEIITRPETTISAIEQTLEVLAPGGIISVVVYHGHPGGKEEKDALLDFAENLSQKSAHVLMYQFINQINNPPFLLAFEKK